jgi:hypothetical protein
MITDQNGVLQYPAWNKNPYGIPSKFFKILTLTMAGNRVRKLARSEVPGNLSSLVQCIGHHFCEFIV